MQTSTSSRFHTNIILKSATTQTLPVILLLFSAILAVLTVTYADPDLWGHLRFGLDFLQTGTIARTDPYSYLSEGQKWINHEWLAEVLFALAWTIGGATGLILLKAAVGIVTFALLFLHTRQFNNSTIRQSILILLTLMLLLPFLSPVRPQLFTVLLFTSVLLILVKAEYGSYHLLWGIAPLFAFWINLHGGVLAGLGVLGIFVLIHRPTDRHAWRQILPPVVISVIALLANPYGIELISFLLRTATVPRPEIADWQPLQIRSILGANYLVVFSASVAGIIFSTRERRLALVVLFFVLSLLPLLAVRHLQLFAPAAVVLAGEHVLDAWARFMPRRIQSHRAAFLFQCVCLAVVVASPVWIIKNIDTGIRMSQDKSYPRMSVLLLKSSGIEGNLAVPFGWGEYTLWHLGPGIKVSMDGRRETVYSDEVYHQNLDFMFGRGEWDAILTDYNTHLALVERGTAPYNLLSLKEDWLLVYEDDVSGIFVNENSQLHEPLQKHIRFFNSTETLPTFP